MGRVTAPPTWMGVMGSDLHASLSFSSSVFGWEHYAFPDQPLGYSSVSSGGRIIVVDEDIDPSKGASR